MALKSLLILGDSGGLLLYRPFGGGGAHSDENQMLVAGSMLFGMYNISSEVRADIVIKSFTITFILGISPHCRFHPLKVREESSALCHHRQSCNFSAR